MKTEEMVKEKGMKVEKEENKSEREETREWEIRRKEKR